MARTHTFIRPSEALPGWLAAQAFRVGQLGPVDLPVAGARQLTIDDAVCDRLDGWASGHGKAALEPGIDGGAGNAKQSGDSCLTASGMKGGFDGINHADIVHIGYANGQQDVAAPLIKSAGMEVWKNIEEELHRRKLNAAWLGKKLGASRQVISGWKKRGVPTARYEEIAALFEWTLDRLVTPLEPAAAPAAQPAAPQDMGYSPMALDIARRLDAIEDEQQRSRAYALFLQIATLSAAPAPKPFDRGQAAPVGQPTPVRRHAT